MAAQTQMSMERTWWTRGRPFTLAELVADGIIHVVGILVAVALGAILLAVAGFGTAPEQLPALVLYIVSLLVVLGVSLAFNLCPIRSPAKRTLARLDQAAIFLFIAGSYTPFLRLLEPSTATMALSIFIWGGALGGALLKLVVPQKFGRSALALYLALGWSGVLLIQSLASQLPPVTLWLVVAGGLAYSIGVIFHLWERLSFHNAIWHACVVLGASLHLVAVLDCLVISRL